MDRRDSGETFKAIAKSYGLSAGRVMQVESESRRRKEAEGLNPVIAHDDLWIDDLGLSSRTINCLKAEGVYTACEASKISKSELIKIPNMGAKSANELIETLHMRGFL